MMQAQFFHKLTIWGIIVLLLLLSHKRLSFLRFNYVFQKYEKFIKYNKLWNLLYTIPILLGLEMAFASPIDNNSANFLIVTMSILIAVFYGCISFFISFDLEKSVEDYKKINKDNITAKNISDREKQLETVIFESKMIASYEIVITTFDLLLCILKFIINYQENIPFFNIGISWFIYFFLIHIILNIFILLKRFTILYNIV